MFGIGPAAHGEPASRPPPAAPATGGDLAMLRREIDELKKSMKKKRR
jgi:hypothetical protein